MIFKMQVTISSVCFTSALRPLYRCGDHQPKAAEPVRQKSMLQSEDNSPTSLLCATQQWADWSWCLRHYFWWDMHKQILVIPIFCHTSVPKACVASFVACEIFINSSFRILGSVTFLTSWLSRIFFNVFFFFFYRIIWTSSWFLSYFPKCWQN